MVHTYSSPPSPCWQCHISELLLVIHTCQNRLTMKGGALCCTENQINSELTNLLFLRPITEAVLFLQLPNAELNDANVQMLLRR